MCVEEVSWSFIVRWFVGVALLEQAQDEVAGDAGEEHADRHRGEDLCADHDEVLRADCVWEDDEQALDFRVEIDHQKRRRGGDGDEVHLSLSFVLVVRDLVWN